MTINDRGNDSRLMSKGRFEQGVEGDRVGEHQWGRDRAREERQGTREEIRESKETKDGERQVDDIIEDAINETVRGRT